jgi:excisionase family DNA binding protein
MSTQLEPTERAAYSAAEVAARYGVTKAHVQNLIARGELPSFKLGRRRLIPASALRELEGLTDGPGEER